MSASAATETAVSGIFLVFVALTVAGALLAALSARVIRGVCGLAVCCLGLAGLYYYLNSPFLALMELLVYIGAICVTIVFAIMLAEPDELPSRPRRGTVWWAAGALLGSTAVCWSLMRLGTRHVWPAPATHITDGSVNAIGVSLLTTYCLAFEGISLVLFAAILGALAIARRGRTKP